MTYIIFYFLVFLFGASLASFFNVLAERLPKGGKVVLARSRCPECRAQLKWPDLIPVFSFVWLGGQCRYCGKKISSQYLLGEVILGAVFVLIAWQAGLVISLAAGAINFNAVVVAVFLWLVSGALLAIFIADLKYFIIPDEMLRLIFILTLFYRVASWGLRTITGGFILETLISSLVLGGIFLAVYLISRGKWLGFGDVKLFFLAGLLLGAWSSFLMLLLASLAGTIVGVYLIVFGGKNLKTALPFGAFLAPAILFTLLFGERIINFYMKILSF